MTDMRTALVTGGTGGMGRVIAARLAADGYDVAVAYTGNVDLADEASVSALFEAVDGQFGHLDVVVHTAGINRPAPLADLDLADLDAILRVNVRGTFVNPTLTIIANALRVGDHIGGRA
jgi:3-oxoacyl-[acyl-carrier protein] reductase